MVVHWVAAYLPFTNTSKRGFSEVRDRLLTGNALDFR